MLFSNASGKNGRLNKFLVGHGGGERQGNSARIEPIYTGMMGGRKLLY